MNRKTVFGLTLAAVIAVGLWVFPAIFFPAPGINDAMALANLALPVVGLILLGSILALVVGAIRKTRSGGDVALGSFLIGVAVALVIGLVVFGNLSDDRFMPLVFLPVPFGAVGLVILVVGAIRGSGSANVRGLVVGLIATAVLVAWVVVKGAQDWLLAPYGFDVLMLIALEATVAYWVGTAVGTGRLRAEANRLAA